MTQKSFYYPEVALLITHYNRSASLERLLNAFKSLDCRFGQMVVSDDGSTRDHVTRLENLREVYGFTLLLSPKNAGLGRNINKGQDAVSCRYTLYVQEDFEPTSRFPAVLDDALSFMEKDPALDLARFYAYFNYPVTSAYGKGFSQIQFKWSNLNHIKFYCYSDHPHLRRSSFFQRFGRYREGVKGDTTEFSMALSFIHHGGKDIFYDDFSSLFLHSNTSSEPSTMARPSWKESDNWLIVLLRPVYLLFRTLVNSVQLLLFKGTPER
jgi:glycosyltransferase involved in cell wall biosynthesis